MHSVLELNHWFNQFEPELHKNRSNTEEAFHTLNLYLMLSQCKILSPRDKKRIHETVSEFKKIAKTMKTKATKDQLLNLVEQILNNVKPISPQLPTSEHYPPIPNIVFLIEHFQLNLGEAIAQYEQTPIRPSDPEQLIKHIWFLIRCNIQCITDFREFPKSLKEEYFSFIQTQIDHLLEKYPLEKREPLSKILKQARIKIQEDYKQTTTDNLVSMHWSMLFALENYYYGLNPEELRKQELFQIHITLCELIELLKTESIFNPIPVQEKGSSLSTPTAEENVDAELITIGTKTITTFMQDIKIVSAYLILNNSEYSLKDKKEMIQAFNQNFKELSLLLNTHKDNSINLILDEEDPFASIKDAEDFVEGCLSIESQSNHDEFYAHVYLNKIYERYFDALLENFQKKPTEKKKQSALSFLSKVQKLCETWFSTNKVIQNYLHNVAQHFRIKIHVIECSQKTFSSMEDFMKSFKELFSLKMEAYLARADIVQIMIIFNKNIKALSDSPTQMKNKSLEYRSEIARFYDWVLDTIDTYTVMTSMYECNNFKATVDKYNENKALLASYLYLKQEMNYCITTRTVFESKTTSPLLRSIKSIISELWDSNRYITLQVNARKKPSQDTDFQCLLLKGIAYHQLINTLLITPKRIQCEDLSALYQKVIRYYQQMYSDFKSTNFQPKDETEKVLSDLINIYQKIISPQNHQVIDWLAIVSLYSSSIVQMERIQKSILNKPSLALNIFVIAQLSSQIIGNQHLDQGSKARLAVDNNMIWTFFNKHQDILRPKELQDFPYEEIKRNWLKYTNYEINLIPNNETKEAEFYLYKLPIDLVPYYALSLQNEKFDLHRWLYVSHFIDDKILEPMNLDHKILSSHPFVLHIPAIQEFKNNLKTHLLALGVDCEDKFENQEFVLKHNLSYLQVVQLRILFDKNNEKKINEFCKNGRNNICQSLILFSPEMLLKRAKALIDLDHLKSINMDSIKNAEIIECVDKVERTKIELENQGIDTLSDEIVATTNSIITLLQSKIDKYNQSGTTEKLIKSIATIDLNKINSKVASKSILKAILIHFSDTLFNDNSQDKKSATSKEFIRDFSKKLQNADFEEHQREEWINIIDNLIVIESAFKIINSSVSYGTILLNVRKAIEDHVHKTNPDIDWSIIDSDSRSNKKRDQKSKKVTQKSSPVILESELLEKSQKEAKYTEAEKEDVHELEHKHEISTEEALESNTRFAEAMINMRSSIAVTSKGASALTQFEVSKAQTSNKETKPEMNTHEQHSPNDNSQTWTPETDCTHIKKKKKKATIKPEGKMLRAKPLLLSTSATATLTKRIGSPSSQTRPSIESTITQESNTQDLSLNTFDGNLSVEAFPPLVKQMTNHKDQCSSLTVPHSADLINTDSQAQSLSKPLPEVIHNPTLPYNESIILKIESIKDEALRLFKKNAYGLAIKQVESAITELEKNFVKVEENQVQYMSVSESLNVLKEQIQTTISKLDINLNSKPYTAIDYAYDMLQRSYQLILNRYFEEARSHLQACRDHIHNILVLEENVEERRKLENGLMPVSQNLVTLTEFMNTVQGIDSHYWDVNQSHWIHSLIAIIDRQQNEWYYARRQHLSPSDGFQIEPQPQSVKPRL